MADVDSLDYSEIFSKFMGPNDCNFEAFAFTLGAIYILTSLMILRHCFRTKRPILEYIFLFFLALNTFTRSTFFIGWGALKGDQCPTVTQDDTDWLSYISNVPASFYVSAFSILVYKFEFVYHHIINTSKNHKLIGTITTTVLIATNILLYSWLAASMVQMTWFADKEFIQDVQLYLMLTASTTMAILLLIYGNALYFSIQNVIQDRSTYTQVHDEPGLEQVEADPILENPMGNGEEYLLEDHDDESNSNRTSSNTLYYNSYHPPTHPFQQQQQQQQHSTLTSHNADNISQHSHESSSHKSSTSSRASKQQLLARGVFGGSSTSTPSHGTGSAGLNCRNSMNGSLVPQQRMTFQPLGIQANKNSTVCINVNKFSQHPQPQHNTPIKFPVNNDYSHFSGQYSPNSATVTPFNQSGAPVQGSADQFSDMFFQQPSTHHCIDSKDTEFSHDFSLERPLSTDLNNSSPGFSPTASNNNPQTQTILAKQCNGGSSRTYATYGTADMSGVVTNPTFARTTSTVPEKPQHIQHPQKSHEKLFTTRPGHYSNLHCVIPNDSFASTAFSIESDANIEICGEHVNINDNNNNNNNNNGSTQKIPENGLPMVNQDRYDHSNLETHPDLRMSFDQNENWNHGLIPSLSYNRGVPAFDKQFSTGHGSDTGHHGIDESPLSYATSTMSNTSRNSGARYVSSISHIHQSEKPKNLMQKPFVVSINSAICFLIRVILMLLMNVHFKSQPPWLITLYSIFSEVIPIHLMLYVFDDRVLKNDEQVHVHAFIASDVGHDGAILAPSRYFLDDDHDNNDEDDEDDEDTYYRDQYDKNHLMMNNGQDNVGDYYITDDNPSNDNYIPLYTANGVNSIPSGILQKKSALRLDAQLSYNTSTTTTLSPMSIAIATDDACSQQPSIDVSTDSKYIIDDADSIQA